MIRRGFLKALTIGLATSFIPRRAAVARPVVPVLPAPSPVYRFKNCQLGTSHSGGRALLVDSSGRWSGPDHFASVGEALSVSGPGDVIWVSRHHAHVAKAARI